MKIFNTLMAAAGLLLLTSAGVMAHTDEYLDTQQAPNGGQLRMAGVYHFELVVAKDAMEGKESPVMVYVTDHAGTKIPTEGASGTAVILADKRKTSIVLVPDGENRLKGSGQYLSTPDMKVVLSVTLAGQAAEQARFTPLAAKPDGMAGMQHAQ